MTQPKQPEDNPGTPATNRDKEREVMEGNNSGAAARRVGGDAEGEAEDLDLDDIAAANGPDPRATKKDRGGRPV
jgi:hypothetical protein